MTTQTEAASIGSYCDMKDAKLVLEDGTEFTGKSFGAESSSAGEVIFNTGMTGYPETLTDPSYYGQILSLTFPLIGNYGVPPNRIANEIEQHFESDRIQIAGLIVSHYTDEFSHWNATRSLAAWLKKYNVPGLTCVDTRTLTRQLREKGTMLGRIVVNDEEPPLFDPNSENITPRVTVEKPILYGSGSKRVVLLDCGAKHNIARRLARPGLEVLRVPWDHDLQNEKFDGLVLSNGPGDPTNCGPAIHQVRRVIQKQVPIFGICLGHQLLSLALGARTYRLKFGHRSQNQPVLEVGTNRCLVTSQNHGFAVDSASLPEGWQPWFTNLNDETNEGIRHESLPMRSVQFHPEHSPGPVDAVRLLDEFLDLVISK